MDDLDHELLGLDGSKHVLTQCLLLDCVAEALRYLVVDIGIEKGTTYVLEGLGNIDFGNLAFTLEYFP